jgi:hypothetical protein
MVKQKKKKNKRMQQFQKAVQYYNEIMLPRILQEEESMAV